MNTDDICERYVIYLIVIRHLPQPKMMARKIGFELLTQCVALFFPNFNMYILLQKS